MDHGESVREAIALEAYYLCLKRGQADYQDVEDWLQAERLVLERHPIAVESPVTPEPSVGAKPRTEHGKKK